MKKTVSLFLALVMALSLLCAFTATAHAEWLAYNASSNGKSLNVREAPSGNSKRLGSIPYGDSVTALYDENSSWTCIRWKGGYGYVSSRYLSTKQPSGSPKPGSGNKKENAKKEAQKLRNEQKSEKVVDPYDIFVLPPRVTASVNFRSGPSSSTKRIGKYYDGKILTVLAETNNWYKAQDPDTLAVGYISKKFTRVMPKAAVQETVSDGTEQLGTLNVNGKFNLTCKLPESYKMQVINMRGSTIYAAILSDDMTKPTLTLTIANDETYSEVQRMNDLTEEELKLLEGTFNEQDEVDISYAETGHGTKLLIAKENDGDSDTDFVRILSIYKGYFIEFDMQASETAAEKSLTDEQIKMCIDFLTNLDFNEIV